MTYIHPPLVTTQNVNVLNFPIKRLIGRMTEKTRYNHMLYRGDTIRLKDTNRLKIKEWKKVYHANNNQ